MTALSPVQSLIEVEDKQLLKLYIDGEIEALSELFRRHNSKMKTIAYRITKNNADAEDVDTDDDQDPIISVPFGLVPPATTWLSRMSSLFQDDDSADEEYQAANIVQQHWMDHTNW
jgi:hypothetical protein